MSYNPPLKRNSPAQNRCVRDLNPQRADTVPSETYRLESVYDNARKLSGQNLVVRSQRPRSLTLQGGRGSALPAASGSGRNVEEVPSGTSHPGTALHIRR